MSRITREIDSRITREIDMSRITREQVDLCAKHDACQSGLDWAYDNIGANWEDVRPDWALWAVMVLGPDIITPERLDWCAEMEPLVALVYTAEHLTAERLDLCAKMEHWVAIRHALKHLTPERIDWCRKKNALLCQQNKLFKYFA